MGLVSGVLLSGRIDVEVGGSGVGNWWKMLIEGIV